MPKEEIQNCWMHMNCPEDIKENCEAYKLNSGKECWLLIDVDKGCQAFKENGGCFSCSWYKKYNPT